MPEPGPDGVQLTQRRLPHSRTHTHSDQCARFDPLVAWLAHAAQREKERRLTITLVRGLNAAATRRGKRYRGRLVYRVVEGGYATWISVI